MIDEGMLAAAFAVCVLTTAYSADMSVVNVAGVPRFAVDGKPVAATAVMPSPAGKPGAALPVLKDFGEAGVRFASDVWTMHDRRYNPRQWWIDEGVYDFELFDAIVRGLIDASPQELIFPRIKIDPPAKWSDRHPEEVMEVDMIPGRSVRTPRPDSTAWRKLYRGMIKDMIAHVEKSDYADKVIGYHLGAFHCGEWLTSGWKNTNLFAKAECDILDALAPYSKFAARKRDVDVLADAVADMLIDAASCVKECTGGRKLVGAFFGYYSASHGKVSRVLRSRKVDFFAAPPCYYIHREIGQAGRSQSFFQASYRLHNAVFFEESDYRTFLSDEAFAPVPQTRRRSLNESIALVRRSIGKSLCGGWENWWFMLGGNNTFSAPEIMESIRIGAAESAMTLESAKWQPAEVAVFTAADEYVTAARGATHASYMTTAAYVDVHRDLLPFCGVPFDSYELADIADARLPDYKVYIFPNLFTLSVEMRERIKAVVRRSGRTAIWFCAPGYYDCVDEGCASRVSELTGVSVKWQEFGENPPCRRMLAPSASPVCERDGWRSVFMSMPPRKPSEMRVALRTAGVHIYLDTDDVLAAGRGYVMVHAAVDGEKTVILPQPGDSCEIFGMMPPQKDAAVIKVSLKRGETRVWRISGHHAAKD